MAGVFATILTHPIDVVRAQLTVQTTTTKGDLIIVIVCHYYLIQGYYQA